MVFDSWAWMALAMGAYAATQVRSLIHAAADAPYQLWMTTVNVGEIWYSLARSKSPKDADEALETVALAGIRIVPADWALTYRAARFKARHRISYADAFAAALAHQLAVELVTGDPEFRALEGDIKIRWLSRTR